MDEQRGKKYSLKNGWLGIRALQASQRRYLYRELAQARELFPLLTKPRKGRKWTLEERTMLLRSLSKLSPYLITLVLPGGLLLLPLLAWWLERRHKKRKGDKH